MCIKGVLYCLKAECASTQMPPKLLVVDEIRSYTIGEDGLSHQSVTFLCKDESGTLGVMPHKLLNTYYNPSKC